MDTQIITNSRPVSKGYWTFEILDGSQDSMVPETVIGIKDTPALKVLEKREVETNVWKPVLIVWERFIATYIDEKFLANHDYIRLLEANGDAVGMLRRYSKVGEHKETWVLYGLKFQDADHQGESFKATFTFDHALFLTESYGRTTQETVRGHR